MDYLRKSVINSDAYKNIGSDETKERSQNVKKNTQDADSRSNVQNADSKNRML
ncbi:hypothetical protein [Aminipila sp.]|uniref:hypothetical protein n=1 Tax=Aminipila sp. TaxID=2060095 RepID=UPI00289E9010|nr:hypothetical protein [Aminipila sp.]